ncbi:Retrovirus-related Pol polyprotein from transposon 17.6 [Vitis vinifera]|uniref:Retrovirus-related Pol polyprotein from transposon 17.6 n=1 Tax=Vitis vinifera TaxID=29760 RepID=A0A438IXJ4_VITVI|nr:Retrovirus-related Pol polyprotein from transposon 17.6 [Vitis vinifera]
MREVKVVITLRSGKEVDLPTSKPKHEPETEAKKEKREEIKGKRKGNSTKKEDLEATCKSPVKYKDLGCPTISVMIGETYVKKALLDLGASVNLLPYSVYKQLGLGELKSTSITLSLIDRSVKIPRGMIEDVLVQVDKFYYPVDFVVLDTDSVVKGTNYIPIILERPFLATSNVIINCRNGVMQLTFGNMTLELNIFYMCNKHFHPGEEGPKEMREEILPLFNEEETQEAVKEEPPKLILKSLPTELKMHTWRRISRALLLFLHLLPLLRRIVYLKSSGNARSPWVSPMQVLPKKSGITMVQNDKGEEVSTRFTSGWKVCIDYRKLNVVTRKDHFSLPIIDQVLERVSSHPFYCFLDGYSGDMVERIMEVFIDDITVYGSAFDECLVNLEAVLNRCIEKELVLNWEKCHFMVPQGIVLGHIISSQGIEVDKAKVELIVKLPLPTTIKGVRQFLGHNGFYRRCIKDFSKLARPLCELLVKDAKFVWDDRCQQSFEELKLLLTTAPIVRAPN